MVQAISCPITTNYKDCPLGLNPQLKGSKWGSGIDFSHANLSEWRQCWLKPPNCSVVYPGRMITGMVATSKILPVLSQHGHSELALALAMVRELPSWGYIVEQGGTTLWESWSGMPFDGILGASHNQHQDAHPNPNPNPIG